VNRGQFIWNIQTIIVTEDHGYIYKRIDQEKISIHKTDSHTPGWSSFWSNGSLGSGTLTTFQTRITDVYEDGHTDVHTPVVTSRMYEFSGNDLELHNKQINRPIATGKVGIVIFGEGNGFYPEDDLGSKANDHMTLFTVDMAIYNQIMPLILKGGSVTSPTSGTPPVTSEELLKKADKLVEGKYNAVLDNNKKNLPNGSDVNKTETPKATIHLDEKGKPDNKKTGSSLSVPADNTQKDTLRN